MRQLMAVLTLMLVLVLASGGDLQGYDRYGPGDDLTGDNTTLNGDDHPWGGEDDDSGARESGSESVTPNLGTGVTFVDGIIWQLIEWLTGEDGSDSGSEPRTAKVQRTALSGPTADADAVTMRDRNRYQLRVQN
ncbi:hypothetical protein GF377_11070 [candidate division GN15 bacterium]|nr:hypothetical protein [candidate division GN15 bacterium]